MTTQDVDSSFRVQWEQNQKHQMLFDSVPSQLLGFFTVNGFDCTILLISNSKYRTVINIFLIEPKHSRHWRKQSSPTWNKDTHALLPVVQEEPTDCHKEGRGTGIDVQQCINMTSPSKVSTWWKSSASTLVQHSAVDNNSAQSNQLHYLHAIISEQQKALVGKMKKQHFHWCSSVDGRTVAETQIDFSKGNRISHWFVSTFWQTPDLDMGRRWSCSEPQRWSFKGAAVPISMRS